MAIENDERPDRGDEFTPDGIDAEPVGSDFNPEILAQIAAEGEEGDAGADDAGAASAAEAAAAASASEGKGAMIPKARFDEVNAKAKAAEEEAARLRKELAEKTAGKKEGEEPPAATTEGDKPAEGAEPSKLDTLNTDLSAKLAEADALLLAGQLEEYRANQAEIQRINREIAKEEIRIERLAEEKKAEEAKTQEQLTAELQDAGKEAVALYPFLDINNKDADSDAIAVVKARRFALEDEGMSPAAALRQAVEEKAPRFAKLLGFEVSKEAQEKAEAARKAREATARSKAADASLAQPALPTTGEKDTTFKVNVEKMTDKQFNELPESERRRLRGDAL